MLSPSQTVASNGSATMSGSPIQVTGAAERLVGRVGSVVVAALVVTLTL
jgi:hypothetical protein